MKLDPIVEEVRKVRQAHAAKFNYDLAAICADLKKKEKRLRSPGRISSTQAAAETYRKLTIGLRKTRRTAPLTHLVRHRRARSGVIRE